MFEALERYSEYVNNLKVRAKAQNKLVKENFKELRQETFSKPSKKVDFRKLESKKGICDLCERGNKPLNHKLDKFHLYKQPKDKVEKIKALNGCTKSEKITFFIDQL